MEKGNTRIPKLTFGFTRKSQKTPGTLSEGNSPRNNNDGGVAQQQQQQSRSVTPTGTHSAPGSNNTSPNLSRSRSLRVPRTMAAKRAYSNSALLEEEQEGTPPSPSQQGFKSRSNSSLVDRNRDAGGEERGFIRPRSKTIGPGAGRRVDPTKRNSRSMSPSQVLDSQGGAPEQDSLEETPPPFRRQAKSFSAGKKNLTNGTSGIASPTLSIARANSMRRSKTPTSLTSSVRSRYAQDAGDRGVGKQSLVRTGSTGRLAKHSTQLQQESTDKVILRRSSVRRDSLGSGRTKRPSSTYIPSEDAGIFDSPTTTTTVAAATKGQQEVRRSGGRNNSLAVGGKGGTGTRSHSSLGHSSARSPSPPTSSSSSTGLSSHRSATTLSSSTEAPPPDSTPSSSSRAAKFLSSKSRSSSIESQQQQPSSRPSSATSNYQILRRGSGGRQSSSGGGGSTPSGSGRNTPVQQHRNSAGGKDVTDGGTVSTSRLGALGVGLPPRTPYRVARTKAVPSSELTGMNELEGSVLLEADDYRRVLNEVKALKTALLRLKREIQEDDGSSAPTPRVGRSRTSPASGQMSSTEYSKKLKAMGQEKEAISEELVKLKKDNKMKCSHVEALSKEVATLKEKQEKTDEELQMVTGQRDRLLEKVERLHADKHSLEARLNTLERASMYEQTWSESWMDEFDEMEGAESSFGESLDTDPSSAAGKGGVAGGVVHREKKGTESDVTDSVQSDGGEGESSEPESMAVCSAPII